ncbi:MAG: tRNA dihydrouridine synthase DusB [Bacilli bacterium]|jgi:nifR3 family TIM-barrel protein
MWKFADIPVKGQVVLAPMAGITTRAYRVFMKRFGVNLFYTEMVSDCGIIYDSRNTMKYLDIDPGEHPIGVQIFGSKAETLVAAVKKLQSMKSDYDFIDVNLGCPMPKVTKNGAGSAWLTRPEELEAMMAELVKISVKPITAKIRIGWDDENINVKDIAERLERAGVSLIAIHTRTTKQIYSGSARHEEIRDLGLNMKVPLVISGDIDSIENAQKALDITKASAVMVARGGLGRPRFIAQLSEYFRSGKTLPDATLAEQLIYLRQLAKRLVALKGEHVAIKELRGLGVHFLQGYPGMKPYKLRLSQLNTFAELDGLLKDIRRRNIYG